MGVISDQAQSPGDLMRRLAELERAVTQLRNARVLENAAIGAGGLRVHSGGSVRIQDGGHLNVSGDADFSGDTSIGGNLDVNGDATIGGPTGLTWTDSDGNVRLRSGRTTAQPSGAELVSLAYHDKQGGSRVWLGEVADQDGETVGHGILVEDASGGDILAARDGRLYMRGDEHAWIESAQSMTVTGGTSTWLLAEENVYIRADGAGGNAYVTGDGHVSITAETGNAYFTAENGSAYVTADLVGFRSPNGSGGWAVDVHSIGSKFNAVADNGFTLRTPNDSHRIQVTGNDIGVDAPNRFYVAANVHATGDLSCGGTKPFIIDHPTKDDKSLVHVATESDKAVVEYHYRVTIGDDGSATIDLPDYFEALTAPDSRGVQVTPVGRPFMVGAEEPADGQVIVYGDPGREAFVRVNARRGDDAGQFEVEIPRIQPPAEMGPVT